MTNRVVVTGLGLITPMGTGVEKSWSALVAGESGIGPISSFDASELSTRFAGEVLDFRPDDFLSKKEAKRLERSQQFALAASDMAMADAGLSLTPGVAERAAVIIGSAVGGLALAEAEWRKVLARGPKAINPLFILGILPSMLPTQVAIRHGFKGPTWGTNSACATSAHAVGEAARLIRSGEAVVALAGGSEAPICIMGMAGFGAIRALSTRNDDPRGASRPWDRHRDGFVLSEGAAVLVLEEVRHATDRGARILGELAGYGSTGDAHHLTVPSPAHEGGQRAMRKALDDAGLVPADIGYINAHATSTPLGDSLEAEAICEVFGEGHAQPIVTSTKSMTGHMTGAGGAAEVVFALLSLTRGVVPPTINLEDPEEGLRLISIPTVAQNAELSAVMSNSFGFGGTNVSLVMRSWEEG